jgi:arylsulfatase A-like enzyme
LVLALLTATAEAAASVALTARHTGPEWPLLLAPAVLGQFLLTHALLWCPAGALLGLLLRRWARSRGALAAPVAGGLVLAVAAAVVPADVELAARGESGTIAAAAFAAAALAAIAVFALLRRAAARGDGRGPERILGAGSLAAAAVLAATFTALARSPLLGPGSYRVPPAAAGPAASPGGPPHVLWIMLDTARPDRMTVHSPELATTPFLAEWAGRSIVCDRAVGNGMWTAPTHASMFTGLSVREHGVTFARPRLPGGLRTVADTLQARGWSTVSFSNNPVVSPATGLTRGFAERHAVDHLRLVTRFSLQSLVQRLGLVPPLPWLDADFGAALTNRMVARWLDRRGPAAGPAFVFVNYMEAHAPYVAPERYRRLFLDPAGVRRSYQLRERAFGDLPQVLNTRFNMEAGAFLPEPDREVLRRQYDATLRYLDDRVRELIRLYDERGLLDRTVVVISSDHGEYLDDHGLWGHEFLTYDELTRVLLMFREPGRTEGLRVAEPVPASDLHGAVLAAALGEPGALPAAGRDGAGGLLAARSGDAAGAPRIAVTEYDGPWPRRIAAIEELDDPRLTRLIHPQIAVQDRRFKLIVSTDGRRELYDLDAGAETANLAAELTVERDRLADRLRQWAESTPELRPAGDGDEAGMDADTVKRLEALGYLGN